MSKQEKKVYNDLANLKIREAREMDNLANVAYGQGNDVAAEGYEARAKSLRQEAKMLQKAIQEGE